MKKFIAEFKEFAMKGNVVDMAIGVVIGAAFGKITTSLVNDVIMPLISRITGGVDFSAWKWVLKAAETAADGTEIPEIAVNYGNFIAVVLDFLIIALVLFMVKLTFPIIGAVIGFVLSVLVMCGSIYIPMKRMSNRIADELNAAGD